MRLFPLFIGASMLLLSGCGTPEVQNWSHPTATEDKTAQDLRACRRASEKHAGLQTGAFTDGRRDAGPMAAYDRDRLQRRVDDGISLCMTSNGYTYAPPRLK